MITTNVSLVEMKAMQADIYLRSAATILADRGLSRHMNCDPETGEVDVEGALMLACGAKKVGVLVPYPAEVVPQTQLAVYLSIIDLLDLNVPVEDITKWTDNLEVSQDEVIQLLRTLADTISIAIV